VIVDTGIAGYTGIKRQPGLSAGGHPFGDPQHIVIAAMLILPAGDDDGFESIIGETGKTFFSLASCCTGISQTAR
ncbi:MAG: hypothetical protein ACREHG_03270, partial [Candidatus Saccharimonadales bacterium]